MPKLVLHHAYIKEGHSLPDGVESPAWFRHVASREEDTGLDVWWWGYPDEDEGAKT